MSTAQHQEFCVRWNSHLGSIGAAFPQLLAGQRFVDVTLACEGHQVHCHRLVLAACSSYFEAILAENPCKHPVIILPSEIKLWEIQALVDFMYKGEVNVTQAGLPQLLRCAEQLRIRGLHGSDAALNLNQLKALTHKATATAIVATTSNDRKETESPNNVHSTKTTSTAGSISTPQPIVTPAPAITQQHQLAAEHYVKKELNEFHSQPKQQKTQQQHSSNGKANPEHFKQESQTSRSNYSSGDDDSRTEDSPVHVFHQNEYFVSNSVDKTLMLESTLDDDHSYVASPQDEESFCATTADTEHETSGNSSILQSSIDSTSAAFKRVRRSEASLAQAAKCVSKGETFQTVSNMFNIPVSTIRFYMARKGILPKRKRGRGASSTSVGIGMSPGTLAEIKQNQQNRGGDTSNLDPQFHLMTNSNLLSSTQV